MADIKSIQDAEAKATSVGMEAALQGNVEGTYKPKPSAKGNFEKFEDWTEKYRPTTVNDVVFSTADQREMVYDWLKDGTIPRAILFSGIPGVGKTTLARVLLKEIHCDEDDILEVDCATDTGVDFIRGLVENFISQNPNGNFRAVIFEEFPQMSKTAQHALKRTIETKCSWVRFIFTANEPDNIIPAIKNSRCEHIRINRLEPEQFAAKGASILDKEGRKYTREALAYYFKLCYPDMRAFIEKLENNSKSGILKAPDYGISNVFHGVEFDESKIDGSLLQKLDNMSSEEIEEVKVRCKKQAEGTQAKLKKIKKAHGAEHILMNLVREDFDAVLVRLATITFYLKHNQNPLLLSNKSIVKMLTK